MDKEHSEKPEKGSRDKRRESGGKERHDRQEHKAQGRTRGRRRNRRRDGRRSERVGEQAMLLHCLSRGCDSEEFTPLNIDVIFGPDGKAREEYIEGNRRPRIVGIREHAVVVRGLSEVARQVRLVPMEDFYCLNCGRDVVFTP